MSDKYLSDAEVLRRVIDVATSEIRVALPGKIITAYPDQTADIQPCIKDSTEAPPILYRVRIAWPRGGDAYLVMPIMAGDTGILLFCDTDLNAWLQTGAIVEPGDVSRHAISGAVFIPGIYPTGQAAIAPLATTVLAGSNLMLGGPTATEPVIKGTTFLTALSAFFTVLSANPGLAVPPPGSEGSVADALEAFVIAIATAVSLKVKVE